MSTLIQTFKQSTYGIAAVILLAAMILPTLLSATVSAAEITNRSINMSTSVPSATDVEYRITFNGVSATNVTAIIVDFCTTPLIGTACVAPAGFSAATPGPATAPLGGTWTATAINSNRTLQLISGTPTALNTSFNIIVSGLDSNPSIEGTFYARILTYASSTGGAHNPESIGSPLDQGTVAMSTAEQIDVTARVNESLTFCVSGTAPGPGCTTTTEPNLTLGDAVQGLQANDVSEAQAFFQLSTNAAGSTYVKLRNGASSGGLNSGTNYILAIGAGSLTEPEEIDANDAGFGVRVPTTSSGDAGEAVTGEPAYASDTSEEFNMRNATTDPYGDPIAGTTGPTSNTNVTLTFGAKASNITPAGIYTAAIVLIAMSTY